MTVSQATIHTLNGHSKSNGTSAKKALPLVGDVDVEKELAKFEAE